jgi:hypothetical protein
VGASGLDLDGVADELYGLAPEDFVTTRTEREKQARAAGDRDLAREIRGLGKPTVVAWLANLLARERSSELEPFLALGADLREATESLEGAELRRLSQQQHRVVQALVQEARGLARSAGRPATEPALRSLEETLRAALTDEELSAALAAGRLTDALSSSGFGAAKTGHGSRARSSKPPPAPRATPKQASKSASRSASKSRSDEGEQVRAERERRERLAAARQEVAEAEDLAGQAAEAVAEADADAERAAQSVDDLAAALDRLQQQVSDLRSEHTTAQRSARKAAAARDRAHREARAADRALGAARDRRDKLT